jgi:hypothetical protein
VQHYRACNIQSHYIYHLPLFDYIVCAKIVRWYKWTVFCVYMLPFLQLCSNIKLKLDTSQFTVEYENFLIFHSLQLVILKNNSITQSRNCFLKIIFFLKFNIDAPFFHQKNYLKRKILVDSYRLTGCTVIHHIANSEF